MIFEILKQKVGYNSQMEYNMYGGTPLYDGISQFTFGHAADGTAPDDIIRRPKVKL